jgi:hypothetical protein
MTLRYAGLVLAVAGALAIATACGDGAGSRATPPPTATAPGGTATPSPGATAPAPNESGREPIFWRTEDAFASLQAGRAYKVLFRITNGYAEPELSVTATCQSCAAPSERQPIEFVGQRAEPGANETPGSYYPMNIDLPYAGQWEIVVAAGGDTARISADARAGQSSG